MGLTFLQSSHTYILDGEQLPCVSELIHPLHAAIYGEVSPSVMEQAAIRGSAVHAATEALDAAGQAQIPEEYLPHVQAYVRFIAEHSVRWRFTEKPLYHPSLRYAGTIDRYGLVDGGFVLMDIKTTYAVNRALVRAQLSLYCMMLRARGIPVDKLMVLHLKKDGSYRLIEIPFDQPLAISLITIHQALKKGN